MFVNSLLCAWYTALIEHWWICSYSGSLPSTEEDRPWANVTTTIRGMDKSDLVRGLGTGVSIYPLLPTVPWVRIFFSNLLHQGQEWGRSVAHINNYREVSSFLLSFYGGGPRCPWFGAHYRGTLVHTVPSHSVTFSQKNKGLGSITLACSKLNQQTQPPAPLMVLGNYSSVVSTAGLWVFSSH